VAAGSTTIPPPDRSGFYLPWAILSFPWCLLRVNHLTPAVGIRARASASLKGVNAGSYRTISRIATVAPIVGLPHDAGVAGLHVNATEPPPTVGSAVANRPSAIVTANSFDPL
jgi:hypothetical protein